MATVNFSDLQASSNATTNSQVLVRLDNSLSGTDGFSRVSVFNFGKSLNVNSTVASNSATNWNYQGTDIKALTSNWQNTYTNFSAQSANNLSVYTTVNANSATNWNYQGNDIKSLTGNWQNTYSTVSSYSATWNSGGGYSTTFLSGGTTNQIFTKNNNSDYNGSWKNKRISYTLPTLTATGVINCNALSADQFVVSISGISVSATFAAPTDPYDAQLIMWNVRYRTNIASVSLSSNFRLPTTTLNWSISANTMDIFAAKYNSLDVKWDVVSFAPGYTI